MGSQRNMLRNALDMIGWAIIVSSIAADVVTLNGMLRAVSELNAGFDDMDYPGVWEPILSFISGIFQGIGLGLLCLYAAHKLKPENSKEVFD